MYTIWSFMASYDLNDILFVSRCFGWWIKSEVSDFPRPVNFNHVIPQWLYLWTAFFFISTNILRVDMQWLKFIEGTCNDLDLFKKKKLSSCYVKDTGCKMPNTKK